MTEKIYGEHPRPRVVVIGVPEDSPFGRWISSVSGWARFVSNEAQFRPLDYDVLVLSGLERAPQVGSNLHIVQFGGDPQEFQEANGSTWRFTTHPGAVAERFMRGPAADLVGVESLVQSLIPIAGDEYSTLTWMNVRVYGESDTLKIHSFLSEHSGRPVAGFIDRPDGETGEADTQAEYWWLPSLPESTAKLWITAAFKWWKTRNPAMFPIDGEWSSEPRWMTSEELDATKRMDDHKGHVASTMKEFEAHEEELASELDRLREVADAGPRRLLTATGDELVHEVATVLRGLGYQVENSDLLPENSAGKQEDLRVSLADWVCLVEVKGYANRNAKEGDLLQLNKAAETYILRNGRQPDARWYIVNQSYQTQPGQRRPPLEGAVGLVHFEQLNGLVIDTRDLFRLRRAVADGTVTHEVAHELLSATGVFSFE